MANCPTETAKGKNGLACLTVLEGAIHALWLCVFGETVSWLGKYVGRPVAYLRANQEAEDKTGSSQGYYKPDPRDLFPSAHSNPLSLYNILKQSHHPGTKHADDKASMTSQRLTMVKALGCL